MTKVYCELTGEETCLKNTRILTRINGIINIDLLQGSRVDNLNKIIYVEGRKSLNFYNKIKVPENLVNMVGELYSIVNDDDEVEQTTHILSDNGLNIFNTSQLGKLVEHLKTYELINFPEKMFFVLGNNIQNENLKLCDNWKVEYPEIGRKYMAKKILEFKTQDQKFGQPSLLLPGFDVAVGDCSANHPNGKGYLFKTDRNFTPINLCCNESAVDYCVKYNSLIYYNDFINGGKMRVLSPYTEIINKNLQNNYKFRSSNI